MYTIRKKKIPNAEQPRYVGFLWTVLRRVRSALRARRRLRLRAAALRQRRAVEGQCYRVKRELYTRSVVVAAVAAIAPTPFHAPPTLSDDRLSHR